MCFPPSWLHTRNINSSWAASPHRDPSQPYSFFKLSRVRQMRLFWRTYLCMLLRTYANVCVHRLCFWMGFFLQITSYLLPFGNAKSAIYLNDRLSNDTDQTFLEIYFLNIFSKRYFLKVSYINLTLTTQILNQTKKLIWIFIFTLLLQYREKCY